MARGARSSTDGGDALAPPPNRSRICLNHRTDSRPEAALSRAQRLLNLIQILRSHRFPVKGAQLAEDLGISLRTLYRDIATLQTQGARIEGEPGLGYILRPGFMLPPLMFTEEEIEAIVLGSRWVAARADDGLRTGAKSALNKIAAVLPPDRRDELDATALLIGPASDVAPESPTSPSSAKRSAPSTRQRFATATSRISKRHAPSGLLLSAISITSVFSSRGANDVRESAISAPTGFWPSKCYRSAIRAADGHFSRNGAKPRTSLRSSEALLTETDSDSG